MFGLYESRHTLSMTVKVVDPAFIELILVLKISEILLTEHYAIINQYNDA
jgi:hypothetical protein